MKDWPKKLEIQAEMAPQVVEEDVQGQAVFIWQTGISFKPRRRASSHAFNHVLATSHQFLMASRLCPPRCHVCKRGLLFLPCSSEAHVWDAVQEARLSC
jgi:hypothetical protein